MFNLKLEERHFFKLCLDDLAQNTSLNSMDDYLQHGTTSCLWHSVAVAYYSFWLVRALGVKCDHKSLIYGALLHDYFLYDWHLPSETNKTHGFRHPRIALENAMRDCTLNEVECNIIERHMFPLTPKPPRFREGVVVCLMDKICSLAEVFKRSPYRMIKRDFFSAVIVSFKGELLHDGL